MRVNHIRHSLLVLSLTTIASLGGVAARPALAQSTDDIAAALQSRNWWHDYGTFFNKANGVVYLFGPNTSASGWYTGERVKIINDFQNNRLGIAWNPFVESGYSGVMIDHSYAREYYFFTGFDAQTETLSWLSYTSSGWQSGFWRSTRSSLVPSKIRQYYYK